MKAVPLSRGYVALVDDVDYERVAHHIWTAQIRKHTLYAATHVRRPDGKRVVIRMHRSILDAKPGEEVDHRDGHGWNNRRNNIRCGTRSQNQQNRHTAVGKSGILGVRKLATCNRWTVKLTRNSKSVYLGLFSSAGAAVVARAQFLAKESAHV